MTSNAVASIDDPGTLEVLPPARTAPTSAVAMLDQHVQMMQYAFELAEKMVRTEMVPSRYRGKPEDATAVILYGAELGLNPIQSLQNIFPGHGMPSMYARTMEALLRAKGYRFKTIEGSITACERWCWAPGDDEPEQVRYTIEDAIRNEYVPVADPAVKGGWKLNANGKLAGNMKYITDPQAMLFAKTTALLCRHTAPDVLLGIAYAADELESEPDDRADSGGGARRIPERGIDAVRAARERRQAQRQEPPIDADIETDTPTTPATAPEGLAEPPANRRAKTAAGGVHPDLAAKQARDTMTKAIFATFGDLSLNGDDRRDDRMVVIRALVDKPQIGSSKELTDGDLQTLRSQLADRKKAGTLDDDVRDFLNAATLAAENQE